MKFLDLLRMSSSNLWKRKVRTILTVLGVVIGVASIVVMVSLGLGLSRSLMAEYESYGGLTQIEVNEPWNDSSTEEVKRLDQKLIDEILAMEHVESVYPILRTNAYAMYGSYQGYLQIQGLPKEYFEEMNITVGEGRLPGNDQELTFFYGCQVLQDFYNAKGSGGSYWETGILPDIDLMNDPIFVIFDMDAYYQAGSTDENGQTIKPPKKYLIETCGVEASPGENQYSQYGWYTYCDIEELEKELRKIFKNKVIPGQPQTKTGKPYKEIFYNQLLVNVDSMDNVVELQNQLADLGYNVYSQAEWVESDQKTMGYIQAVLGGIGAVSLFVAAIGITNTMMMSIYERTKEIGVMKVLGCDLKNIRSLFLMEAGFIGFIGGVIGLILSFGLSVVINKVAAGANEYMGTTGGISYIPIWLVFVALVFAILVGMVAGFFPARRAMRLSPLAAIRNE
ncbi:MAG: ABC transporter permease [Bacteroidales bacterium]|nr:ABC transporter permease [Bacteroidales bacterium]MCM1415359.1 ABC transporter permease [bacterium]MCM1424547.1 ABC transporter permease [bacterium]